MTVPIGVTFWRKKYLTQMVALSNFLVFVFVFALTFFDQNAFNSVYDELHGTTVDIYSPLQYYRFYTYMFLHGGAFHLFGNLFFLVLVGPPFEDRVGTKAFAVIYFTSGIVSAIVFDVANLGRLVGLVGASGAIFGLLGAYAYLYPRDKIMFPLFFFIRPFKVWIVFLFYVGLEMVMVGMGAQDGVAHWGHLGGFLGGVAAALLLLKRGWFEKDRKPSKHQVAKTASRVEALRPLAVTEELAGIFETIKGEEIADVREAWIEQFLQKAKCPRCGQGLGPAYVKGHQPRCACGWHPGP